MLLEVVSSPAGKGYMEGRDPVDLLPVNLAA
jgi:hypothetical protein